MFCFVAALKVATSMRWMASGEMILCSDIAVRNRVQLRANDSISVACPSMHVGEFWKRVYTPQVRLFWSSSFGDYKGRSSMGNELTNCNASAKIGKFTVPNDAQEGDKFFIYSVPKVKKSILVVTVCKSNCDSSENSVEPCVVIKSADRTAKAINESTVAHYVVRPEVRIGSLSTNIAVCVILSIVALFNIMLISLYCRDFRSEPRYKLVRGVMVREC